MSKASKPVAKSLHTITVIVQVAKLHRERFKVSNPVAVGMAMETLALNGREDPYGLAAAALKQL